MWPLLVTGLLGSFHCVGMCGGFVLALQRPGRVPWRLVLAQAGFHAGKAATYVLLGGLAGLAGSLWLHSRWFGAAQAVLAVVAGVLMVVAGLQLAGLLKDLPLGRLFGPTSAYARAVRAVVNLRGPAAPLALGALTGLLPCPLVYAFLAAAAATGSVLPAMGTMAVLGLASAPALVLVAFAGTWAAPHLRARLVRAAGVVVLVLGVVTALRGLAPDWVHALHAG